MILFFHLLQMGLHFFFKHIDFSNFSGVSNVDLFSHALELFAHIGYLLHELFILLLLFVVCLLVLFTLVIGCLYLFQLAHVLILNRYKITCNYWMTRSNLAFLCNYCYNLAIRFLYYSISLFLFLLRVFSLYFSCWMAFALV